MDILHSCPHPAPHPVLWGEARVPPVDVWADAEASELFPVCKLTKLEV